MCQELSPIRLAPWFREPRVTITNASMGTQNSTVTTGVGNYTVPQVLAGGIYSVTAVAPGFTTLVRSGITVSVGETATYRPETGCWARHATVTVTADAPLLQTDSPQNNIEVSTNDMNELPFNVAGIGSVRDPMSFAALVPGTIVGGWNDIHISGSPATTYRVFMDGLDDTSAVKGAISDENQPSVESLASQELLVNNYSAEFGESAGGIFNYTSKSGSNRLHGTAFNYLENEDLDAGQPFNYTTWNQKITPVQRQLDFGGSFGGPVVIPHLYNGHDKTFFFFAYEEYHNTQTLNHGTITVPTTAYRNGDLSALLQGPITDSNGMPILDCLGRTVINGAVYNPRRPTSTCPDGSSAGPRPVPEQLYRRAQHLGSGGAGSSSLHSYSIGRHCQRAEQQLPEISAEQQIPVPDEHQNRSLDRSGVAPVGILHRRAVQQGQCG